MIISLTLFACSSGQWGLTRYNVLSETSPSTPHDAAPPAGVAPPTTPVEPSDPGGATSPTAPQEGPLVARVSADVVSGTFPLIVSFDASSSDLGSGAVRYEWSFGDGAVGGSDPTATHTYVGQGTFDATLTLVEEGTDEVSVATVTVDVSTPGCPSASAPVGIGTVDDGGLNELSGIAASRLDPDVFWVQEDSGNTPVLTALDRSGATLGTYGLPDEFADMEDLAAAVDPETGVPLLFLADTGDNARVRSEIAVWVVEEPDPRSDGDLDPLRMEIVYPDHQEDVETLLVDPLTLDLYLVAKEGGGASVYIKRAPHDSEGPFELEALGPQAQIALTATGGDVSPDGTRIVIRDYGTTARMWIRDGYQPLEDAFDLAPCLVGIHDEQQGEAIAFTLDGADLVTVSEGWGPTLWSIGL